MKIDIKDKVILVTGSNRGIGAAIVESLISNGASKIYATARSIDSVQSLAHDYPNRVLPLTLDVTKIDTIKAAAEIALDAQIVINNAGILKTASALNLAAESSLREELEVNTFGLLRIAQIFAPILQNNRPSAFVQINSVASLKCFPDFTTYCASKAAAYSITQALKSEMRSMGIQVLSVHPGPIETDMARTVGMSGEPPSLVSNGIIESLKNGSSHLFPDSVAKNFENAYSNFKNLIIDID